MAYAFLFISSSFSIEAQMTEKNISQLDGEYSGTEIDLKVDYKQAEKIWKDYIKPYGKISYDKKTKSHVHSSIIISSISRDKISLQTKFIKYDSGSKASIIALKGEEAISSETDKDEYKNLQFFLQEYINETDRVYIKDIIKEQEKELDKIEKDLKKLVKQNKNLHEDIENARALILKKEQEIESNLGNQDNNHKLGENQKKLIRQSNQKLSKVGQ